MAGGSMDLRFSWDILATDVIAEVPAGVADSAAPIAGVSTFARLNLNRG